MCQNMGEQLLDDSAYMDNNDSLVYGSQINDQDANKQISEFELERLESFSPELECQYMMDIDHI